MGDTLRIPVKDEDGKPFTLRAFREDVSVGTLGDPHATRPGLWRVRVEETGEHVRKVEKGVYRTTSGMTLRSDGTEPL